MFIPSITKLLPLLTSASRVFTRVPVSSVALDSALPAMLRVKAINVIGLSGDKTAAGVLTMLAKDSNRVVSGFARDALGSLSNSSKPLFNVGNLTMRIPGRATRSEIRFFEYVSAIFRRGRITSPNELLSVATAQKIGLNESLIPFITRSDLRILSQNGIGTVRNLSGEELTRLSTVLRDRLQSGQYRTVKNIFRPNTTPIT